MPLFDCQRQKDHVNIMLMIKKIIFLIVPITGLVAPMTFAKQVSQRKIVRFGKKPAQPKSDQRLINFRKAKSKKKVTSTTPIAKPAPTKVMLQPKKKIMHKRRVVVFSSSGGGGHTAVSKGLKNYFKNDYDVTVVNAFHEVLAPVDALGTITFGKVCSEDFYNFCLRVRWTSVAGTFVSTGKSYLNYRQGALEKLFMEYFKDEKPDLIISVMPTINAALLTVAERLSIPFLVITNDLDTSNYINNISKPTYAHFRYTLAFDDPAMREILKESKFSPEHVVVTGFPLRPEFFKEKDKRAIRRDFEIPRNRPVVMVFMGGAGSLASYRYVRALSKMQTPLHIIACLGRNERLRRNISKILLPDHVTLTIVGFTDRIADLMAVSDVLITKPGPGSVCEGLESNVPMILDQTSGTLWWEQMNIDFMVKHGFAESLVNFTELSDILPKYIRNKVYTESIKKKMRDFKRERFDLRIKPLVKEMIEAREKQVATISKPAAQGGNSPAALGSIEQQSQVVIAALPACGSSIPAIDAMSLKTARVDGHEKYVINPVGKTKKDDECRACMPNGTNEIQVR